MKTKLMMLYFSRSVQNVFSDLARTRGVRFVFYPMSPGKNKKFGPFIKSDFSITIRSDMVGGTLICSSYDVSQGLQDFKLRAFSTQFDMGGTVK